MPILQDVGSDQAMAASTGMPIFAGRSQVVAPDD